MAGHACGDCQKMIKENIVHVYVHKGLALPELGGHAARIIRKREGCQRVCVCVCAPALSSLSTSAVRPSAAAL